jgi:hypothetical protein
VIRRRGPETGGRDGEMVEDVHEDNDEMICAAVLDVREKAANGIYIKQRTNMNVSRTWLPNDEGCGRRLGIVC